MRVVTSDSAISAIQGHGGRLFVWPRKARCCGGTTTLGASFDPPAGREFRRIKETAEFELYLPSALARLPDELEIDLSRFPRRVQAYWDGCAWVV